MTNAVRTEYVALPTETDLDLRAYVARPAGPGRYPGVVVIHEIFGLDGHIEDMSRRLAGVGYTVIAPDLYSVDPFGKTLTANDVSRALGVMMSMPASQLGDPKALGEVLGKLPADQATRIQQVMGWLFSRDLSVLLPDIGRAIDWLRAQPEATGRVGMTGFCYGGGMTLRAAFAGLAIDAAAPFYGGNPPLETVAQVACPLLLMYGREDERLIGDLPKLLDALTRAGKSYELHLYEGAAHAFMNDTRPKVYHDRAATDAWSQLTGFFARHLGG